MKPDQVLRARGLRKIYGTGHQGPRWRSLVPGLPEKVRNPKVALDGLNLDVYPGDAIGLIGPNGAGKSTALKIMAGIALQTTGRLEVNGQIGAMIELGVGFHPDLTGWENMYCSLVIAGHSRRYIDAADDEIAEFAQLEDAMDRPLRSYSMGMRARLAFAVATHAPADLLLIDEVLAVGDRDFQLRCLERIQQMRTDGTALIFVSHEMPLVTQVCDRALHMRHGRVVDDGPAPAVVERYLTTSPSRYQTDPALGMHVDSLDMQSTLTPGARIEAELFVTVDREVAEPKIGVDFTLPTVAPDLISASSLESVTALSQPGRYRLQGTSSPIAFENAEFRATFTLVDGVSVGDVARHDAVVPSTRRSLRPAVAVHPHFEIQAAGEPPAEAPRRTRRPPRVEDAVLRLDEVTKTFSSRPGRLRWGQALPGRLGVPAPGDIVALDHVTFDVSRGQAVGLIGPNGSGKSTLLRAIVGLHRLDSGSIDVRCTPTPMLDVGAGFHPELSGRENLNHVGRLLGSIPGRNAKPMEWIIEFAGLEAEIDAPIRQYSTGMLARLGMAIALAQDSELFLIDEMLAVGDEEFRRATMEEIDGRVRNGSAAIFVSHELRLVEQVCERVVRLDHGQVVDDGDAAEVIDAYGGVSWAGGVADASSGIRLQPLRVRQRHVPIGGTLEIEGAVIVDTPSEVARLELSYRAGLEERLTEMTLEDRDNLSLLSHTLESAGGALVNPGLHPFKVVIDDNDFAGTIDVVLAVVDERDETIWAETWQEVMVGYDRPEGFPGPVFSFEWRAHRLPDGG